jgi:DNA processing protein
VVALGIEEPTFPERLRRIELPPRVLFVRGDVAALSAEAAVAVVGTRRPTDGGRRTASRIGAALARAGALVVSGLAVGIDGAAHAAVVAEGRRTVAVIGGGHARLSFRGPTTACRRDRGRWRRRDLRARPRRCRRRHLSAPERIISGLADAVVVVEAGAAAARS